MNTSLIWDSQGAMHIQVQTKDKTPLDMKTSHPRLGPPQELPQRW